VDELEPADPRGRPWAQGIGLLLLGLAVSAFANGLVLAGAPGPALRALGITGYLGGVLVSGAGVHRLLWPEASQRSRAARLLVTALVTIPVFVGTAIFLSLLFTVLQLRFGQFVPPR
jgi:hypothetical protein